MNIKARFYKVIIVICLFFMILFQGCHNLVVMASADTFTQQHLNFINSSDYQYAISTNWAQIINQGLDTPTGLTGEIMYDILNSAYEMTQFQSLSVFDNPYDEIIVELILSQQEYSKSEFELKYENKVAELVSKVSDFCENMDSGWALNKEKYETELEKFVKGEEKIDKNSTFYKICEKIFKGYDSDKIEKIICVYKQSDHFKSALDNGAKVVNWVAYCINFSATVAAYLETTDLFKQTLINIENKMGELSVIPSSEKYTPKLKMDRKFYADFKAAREKYDAYTDKERVVSCLAEEFIHNGGKQVLSTFSGTIEKETIIYCSEFLGISLTESAWFYACIEAYKTGWEFAQSVTGNQTNIECRQLARAYYYLERAVISEMQDWVTQLTLDTRLIVSDILEDNVMAFDGLFFILKQVELGSINNYIKYLQSQEDNTQHYWDNVVQGKGFSDWQSFNGEEIAYAETLIEKWKTLSCHGDTYRSEGDKKEKAVSVACYNSYEDVEYNGIITTGEYTIIQGLSQSGHILWKYQTNTSPIAELQSFTDIGIHGSQYYFVKSGTVTALDITDGSVLWTNEGNGVSNCFDFSEDGVLFISGYYGPGLSVISDSGETLYRIDNFDGMNWVKKVEFMGSYVVVTIEQTYPDSVYIVNPDDYSYELQEDGDAKGNIDSAKENLFQSINNKYSNDNWPAAYKCLDLTGDGLEEVIIRTYTPDATEGGRYIYNIYQYDSSSDTYISPSEEFYSFAYEALLYDSESHRLVVDWTFADELYYVIYSYKDYILSMDAEVEEKKMRYLPVVEFTDIPVYAIEDSGGSSDGIETAKQRFLAEWFNEGVDAENQVMYACCDMDKDGIEEIITRRWYRMTEDEIPEYLYVVSKYNAVDNEYDFLSSRKFYSSLNDSILRYWESTGQLVLEDTYGYRVMYMLDGVLYSEYSDQVGLNELPLVEFQNITTNNGIQDAFDDLRSTVYRENISYSGVSLDDKIEYIRDWYYTTQNSQDYLSSVDRGNGQTDYYDGKNCVKVNIQPGCLDSGCYPGAERLISDYYYQNGLLYFAFLHYNEEEYRYYLEYQNGDLCCIRYIDADGASWDYPDKTLLSDVWSETASLCSAGERFTQNREVRK